MYLSTVGILVITVIFLGLLFLFTPWLYRPYLDLLEAREALEDPTASPAGSEAVERLEQRVQAQWDEARQEVVNHASEQRLTVRTEAQSRIDEAKLAISERASSEEAELELTIASARTALRDDVAKLADELVSKALGRSA
jgi:F0F1-type ATP synthase membrane subunit b/b'